MAKVLVAMSGGVDSSVAAALLKDKGHELCGVTLKLYENEDIGLCSAGRTCCSLDDVEDARRVAARMRFRHVVFSYADMFRQEVMKRFADEYAAGRTPNPCIDCNRFIKFPRLLQRARLLGLEMMATGHYARSEYDEASGRWLLKKPRDASKDQTYVLYAMTQDELAHTLFPLGNLLKTEVRAIAEERGLVNARKPDSQDICFVPDGDYAGFLKNVMHVTAPEGNFVDEEGHVLGKHRGHYHYTVGQRKGLGVSFGEPRYVVGKDAAKNTVTLGELQDLYVDSVLVDEVNWIAIERGFPDQPLTVGVKTRYHQPESPATVWTQPDGSVLVRFEKPQRAVAPGQAAVFYDGDVVVGGGMIRSAQRDSQNLERVEQ